MGIKYVRPSIDIRWQELVSAARSGDDQRLMELATTWRKVLLERPGSHLRRTATVAEFMGHAKQEASLRGR